MHFLAIKLLKNTIHHTTKHTQAITCDKKIWGANYNGCTCTHKFHFISN